MKKSEAKKSLVQELEKLSKDLNVIELYTKPRQETTKDWIADVASILKNLDESDYQEFVRVSKTITPTEERETRKKAANEIEAFVRRKVREWKRYDFSSLDKSVKTDRGSRQEVMRTKPNFGNFTISGGTVIFGDGNKITQVAVKELVEALEEEIIEKIPDGEEKRSVLRSLKEITTNETFASVAGAFVGELLRRITRPTG